MSVHSLLVGKTDGKKHDAARRSAWLGERGHAAEGALAHSGDAERSREPMNKDRIGGAQRAERAKGAKVRARLFKVGLARRGDKWVRGVGGSGANSQRALASPRVSSYAPCPSRARKHRTLRQ